MRRRAFVALAGVACAQAAPQTLFDGQSFAGWRAPFAEIGMEESWRIRDGALETIPDGELRHGLSTDLWTVAVFRAFDLRFAYWAAPEANGGLKFQVERPLFVEDIAGKQRVLPRFAQAPGARVIAYSLALEFQVAAPDEPVGRSKPAARAGSLYNKVAAPAQVVAKAGEWNQGRVRLEADGRLRLWLNGEESAATRIPLPLRESPIVLQHHGTLVRYRELEIERLG